MYSDEDILGAIQMAAWKHRKPETELTTTEYRDVDFGPSLTTIFDRFTDWETAAETAANTIQQCPSSLSQYHQTIAALRWVYDTTGYPVTSLDYHDHATELPVTYQDVISVHGTWTAAKREAGIHDATNTWGGRDHFTESET